MAEDNEFAIVEIDHLIWPESLQLPTKRFRLFVAADTTRATTDDISNFAEAALEGGMVYFCAWGAGCERFHDIVDEVVVVSDLEGRRFALPNTTWHAHETLEEALEFFATAAVPSDEYEAGSRFRVVLCVGNPGWAAVADRFLKNATFLA